MPPLFGVSESIGIMSAFLRGTPVVQAQAPARASRTLALPVLASQSRIGRKPVALPAGLTVKVESDVVTMKVRRLRRQSRPCCGLGQRGFCDHGLL